MDQQDQVFPIIEKVISKTNDGSLSWTSLSMNQHVFKKPDELDYTTPSGDCITILYDKSYYSRFMDGYIFVLSCAYNIYVETSYVHLNRAPEAVSLYIQPDNASRARLLADSNSSSEVSRQLRRMYNLVEEKASNFERFINDFLNS